MGSFVTQARFGFVVIVGGQQKECGDARAQELPRERLANRLGKVNGKTANGELSELECESQRLNCGGCECSG